MKPDNKDATLGDPRQRQTGGGKSYIFVLVGKPGKYDIVKIEDAVAVQPNQ